MKITLNGNELELTEAQAKEIAEQYGKKEEKTVGIAIMSRWVSGKIVYQSSKNTLREAVIEAVDGDANLSGADLSGANLSGADLSDANLSGADLSNANLSGADLSGANLSGADLSNANLSGADLSGANLSAANLRGAEFQNAKFYGKTTSPKILKQSQVTDFLAALGFKVEV